MTEKNNNLKKLTLAELKKQNKKLNIKEEKEVMIGGDVYKFEIDGFFRKTKQYKLLDDLIEFFNEGNKRPELLDLATPYVSLLLIKHFTSIDVSNDIDEAVELLNILVDLELLADILNLLPEDEVNKIYEIISTTTERMKENMEDTLREIEEVKEKLENVEVKELLDDNAEESE